MTVAAVPAKPKEITQITAGLSLALGERKEIIAKVIDYLQSHKRINTRAQEKILGAVQLNEKDAGKAFLAAFVAAAKTSKMSLWTFAWQVKDGCRKAGEAYHRATFAAPRNAGVYGRQQASDIERWHAAQEVVRQAAANNKATPTLAIDDGPALAMIATLTPTLRVFADAHDAMLRGEKAVSDVYPDATLLALFPSLQGKDLPALLEELARVVESAPKGVLLGLFTYRWLEQEDRDAVAGPLPGDLNKFVARLRRDAQKLREGYVFGPSSGYGAVRGVDPSHQYLRGDMDLKDEGYGIVPTFLQVLARPLYSREDFTFGEKAREAIPSYQGKAAPPLTLSVSTTDKGVTRFVIG